MAFLATANTKRDYQCGVLHHDFIVAVSGWPASLSTVGQRSAPRAVGGRRPGLSAIAAEHPFFWG